MIIINKGWEKHLFRFAKQFDIYQEVCDILKSRKKGIKYHYCSLVDSKGNQVYQHNMKDFFDFILSWDATNEGFRFWFRIHLEWQIFLIEQQVINIEEFEKRESRGSVDVYNDVVNNHPNIF